MAMRRLRDALTAQDLKPRQFQFLGLLHDDGTLGQRELGETMGVDPNVLVTLLNPLEAYGFVSRERDPADRRHVVTFAAAGRRHLDSEHGRPKNDDGDSRVGPAPYSPECVEVEFSEVGLPRYGVLRSSP